VGKLVNGVAGVGGVATAGLVPTAYIMWDRWLAAQEKAAALLQYGQEAALHCEGLRLAFDFCKEQNHTLERLCGQ